MDILELQELKAEYEKELLFVQAKISVVSDIIARTEMKNARLAEMHCESVEEVDEETEATTMY